MCVADRGEPERRAAARPVVDPRTAERGGLSTGRWAGLSLLAVLVALVLALLVLSVGGSRLLAGLTLVLAFVPVVAAHLLAGDERWGGWAGRHESPI